ncbi:hypothetical protein ACIBSW_30835 [Actinoplanes sp. NPDC049668]|uniref:hypothetical protein n=1 Tax=unclassified Actinoplanes TaxID=2626549 RepID=UPI0033BAD528
MGGTHSRPRREVSPTALAVVALVGCAAAVALGVIWMRGDDEATAPPAAVAVVRQPWQLTLGLDATAGYLVTAAVADGGRQSLTVQDVAFSSRPDGVYGGEVTAFPPGTLDEGQFRAGEPVNGAFYLPDFVFPEHTAGDARPWRTAAVGRPDPSGVWVVVYADPARATGGAAVDRDDLLRLAAAVRVGAPRDLRMPLRLGAGLPAGLQLTYVRSPDQRIDRRPSAIGLSAAARRPAGAGVYAAAPHGLDVTVLTAPRDAGWDARRAALTGATSSAGLRAWYEEGRRLTVQAERCVVTIEAALPRAELDRLVERMTIGDCADPDSWIPPLS